jgi:hypothetical protein
MRIRDPGWKKFGSGMEKFGSGMIRNTSRMTLRSPEGDFLPTEDLVTHVGDVVKHCLVLHHEVLLKYPVRLH